MGVSAVFLPLILGKGTFAYVIKGRNLEMVGSNNKVDS